MLSPIDSEIHDRNSREASDIIDDQQLQYNHQHHRGNDDDYE